MTDKEKLDKIKALLPERTNPFDNQQYCTLVESIKGILGDQTPEDLGFYYHVDREGTGGCMPKDYEKEGCYIRNTPINDGRY